MTVAFLLRRNPQAQFWTTYQERRFGPVCVLLWRETPFVDSSSRFSADWTIEALLRRWKLSCADIQLDTFGADGAKLAGSSLPGSHSILMMIITLETEDEDP